MNKRLIFASIKEGVAAGLTIGLVVMLVIYNLGGLLSPVGGVWNSSNQAYYPKYMEIHDSSLDGQVTAYRDLLGIPHIFTESEADFAFAIGYLQAQDRLFSIDVMLRFVQGRVAEFLGEDGLDVDIGSRRMGFGRLGRQMWANLLNSTNPDAPELASLLWRFCDGLNRYISDISPNNLPMEYLYLGIQPESFEPQDLCSLFIFFEYMLSFSGHDLQITRLADGLTKDTLFELIPIDPYPFEVPIIPNFTVPADTGAPLVKGPSEPEEDLSLKALLAGLALEQPGQLKSWYDQFGGCSNNWIVNGSLTTSGYPILCNDPHLMLMVPSIWWEFHYVNTATGESLYGVAFPGMPLCGIGTNNMIAWGATITAIDCTDYYAETLRNGDTEYLFNDTEWRKIEQVIEVIHVKGEPDYGLTVNCTRHNYNPADDFQCPIYASYNNSAVSVKWTGFAADPGIMFAWWGMAHARNVTMFQDALRHATAPGINFAFGSVDGDIGMFPTARYPVRNGSGQLKDTDGYFKGILLLNGSTHEDEWTGYIPFEWIPQKINPDQMYLQSANQRTVNTSEYDKYYLAWQQAAGYRGRSIDRYLKSAPLHSITVEDMQRLQADTLDVAASVFIPELLRAVNATYGNIADPQLNQTVEILTAWNLSGTYADRNEIAPTIWDRFQKEYIDVTFKDEYIAAGIPNEIKPQLSTLEYLTCYNATSIWFNDTRTSQTENASDIMLRALNDTIDYLENRYGNDINEWVWGNIHQIEIQYLGFGGFGGIIPEFDIPKYPADGNGWTINVAGGHNVHSGPSMRMIIDFNNLAQNDTYIGYLSYPGGQSGNPLSPHYRDNFELWRNYQYHSILFPQSLDAYPTDYIEATAVFMP